MQIFFGLQEYQSYSENDFDQKLGILTKLIKKILNFENFENFGKMRQSLAKDCNLLPSVSRESQLVHNVEIKKDFSKFRPIIAKEVRNFSKRYNTHLSAHLQVYKNFIDIEVIYLGTDFF